MIGHTMQTIPLLKVGQVWQCCDQRMTVRITHIRVWPNQTTMVYGMAFRLTQQEMQWAYNPSSVYKAIIDCLVYPLYTDPESTTRGLRILIYDPLPGSP